MKIQQAKAGEFAKNIIGKRKIFCFGAGKAFCDCLDEFADAHLEEGIKYIVDNAPEKQGRTMQCGKREIQIIPPEEMLPMISPEDVLLITVRKFPDIVRQLEVCSELENTECYIYYFLKMEQNDYEWNQTGIPEEFSAKADICIPKIIHYCWFGKGEIPVENRIWMESWKKYCPDYQIIEWNEKNYDVSKNLYIKQAYERGKWAFVSDYARVDIIGEHGGIYLDTDVELIKNLDNLLKNEAFCGFESRRYVSFGLGFGAVKGNKIIKALKDDYENRRFLSENGKMNETTSPVYQTDTLVKYGMKRNGEFQKLDGITVYPQRVLCGMSPYSYRIMERLDDTYSIHHFSGSWLDGEEQDLKEKIMQSVSGRFPI